MGSQSTWTCRGDLAWHGEGLSFVCIAATFLKGETLCDFRHGIPTYRDIPIYLVHRKVEAVKQFKQLRLQLLSSLRIKQKGMHWQLLLNQGCLCAIWMVLAVCSSEDRITGLCEKEIFIVEQRRGISRCEIVDFWTYDVVFVVKMWRIWRMKDLNDVKDLVKILQDVKMHIDNFWSIWMYLNPSCETPREVFGKFRSLASVSLQRWKIQVGLSQTLSTWRTLSFSVSWVCLLWKRTPFHKILNTFDVYVYMYRVTMQLTNYVAV